MQFPRPPLDQGWVGQLSIEVPIHRTTETETRVDIADPWDETGSGAKPKRLKIIANLPLASRQAWMELLLFGSGVGSGADQVWPSSVLTLR